MQVRHGIVISTQTLCPLLRRPPIDWSGSLQIPLGPTDQWYASVSCGELGRDDCSAMFKELAHQVSTVFSPAKVLSFLLEWKSSWSEAMINVNLCICFSSWLQIMLLHLSLHSGASLAWCLVFADVEEFLGDAEHMSYLIFFCSGESSQQQVCDLIVLTICHNELEDKGDNVAVSLWYWKSIHPHLPLYVWER